MPTRLCEYGLLITLLCNLILKPKIIIINLEAKKSTLVNAATLLEQAKALHQACLEAEATIKQLSDKKKDQLKVPDFDQTALEELEKALAEK